MRHEPPAAFTPPDTAQDVARARTYIAATRACGLVIYPWHGTGGRPSVGLCGMEETGPYDFSAGMDRLLKHPDRQAAKGCRKRLVFELLCADYGVKPDDPFLCARINEQMRAAEAARVAS